MSSTILITGASGKLGQRVIAHLLESHHIAPQRLVAATRTPEKLAHLTAAGVQVRHADFDAPNTLATALAGVDQMLLISTDALDKPGRRLAQHQTAVQAAQQAGVKHILYTSMLQPDDSLIPFAPDHLGTEQALVASGLHWTILRHGWYMENLLGTLPSNLASGQWYTAAGDGRVAHVSLEDCARTAAAVLASAQPATNVYYNVTGPEGLTTAEIAAVASEVTGKPLQVIQVSDEQLIQGMIAAGVPEFMAPVWGAFDANTRAGKVAVVSNDVEQLTGQAPQSLRDFLTAHREILG